MSRKSLIVKIAALALLIGLVIVCIGGRSSQRSNDWQTSRIAWDGTAADYPLGSVLVGDPKQIGPDVRIHMVDTLCQKQECRIVAVGKDGRTHLGKETVKLNPTGRCRSTVAVFSGADLEDIEEFRFQSRPSHLETAEIADESRMSDAARKRMLIDRACEGRLWESNYIN
ncbi:MAG: hypothetical protein JXN61_13280 [Sedimentisphaerales bacterium]|nr:hypothetical protein [Sedimentisphaerales bacterium]